MGGNRPDKFTVSVGDLVLVKQGEGPSLAEQAGITDHDLDNLVAEVEKDRKIKEILRQVRSLAVEYYKVAKKPLGVTGEIAEFEAAEKLGLKLADARTADYDAIRQTPNGCERIQIKGRALARKPKPGQRMPQIKRGAHCDSVLLVILDNETLEPTGMWEASYATALQLLDKGGKSRERGALSVREFQRNAKPVWQEPT